jgi:hypothetical protein
MKEKKTDKARSLLESGDFKSALGTVPHGIEIFKKIQI